MITIIKKESTTQEGNILEIRGLSTDTKPTENISNGSLFIEINTGKLFLYDKQNEQWKEI